MKALDVVYKAILAAYPFKNKVILHDKVGCCADYIMSKLALDYNKISDIYRYYDNELLCRKLNGIYIKVPDFIFFDTRKYDKAIISIDLNKYYYGENLQRRMYSCDDYIQLAEYFFNYPL